MKVCPRCGRPVLDFNEPPTDEPRCTPIQTPDCWVMTPLSNRITGVDGDASDT